ncbi:MAG: hypothetical protein RSB11_04620, partial [Oscillospiraceae bacterium]
EAWGCSEASVGVALEASVGVALEASVGVKSKKVQGDFYIAPNNGWGENIIGLLMVYSFISAL